MERVKPSACDRRTPSCNSVRGGATFVMLAGLLAAQASGQQVALSLGSGSGLPGSTVTVSMTMTASGGAQPSGLQWTMSYSSSAISGVVGTIGGAASAAGKTLQCSYGSGTANCLVIGINTTAIASGTVATFAFTIASGAPSGNLSLNLSGLAASSGLGASIPTTGSGGVITVLAATPPVSVGGLSCAPQSVNAPGSSTCTVTLSGAAPTGGFAVSLSDDSASVAVPGSVTVPTGASSAQFTATVSSVSGDQTATISASAGGATRTFGLTLLAQTQATAQLSSLSCAPGTLGGGQGADCTVTLTRVATTAAIVTLTSSHAVLSVPPAVTVGAGSASAQFQVTATPSASAVTVSITASLNNAAAQQILSVLPVSGPVITSPSHVGASVAIPVRFEITAADPQGLPVLVSVAGVPAGASYNQPTGQFAWVPDWSQAGTHTLTATARNSAGAASTRVIHIRVLSQTASVQMARNSANLQSADFCSPGSWAGLFGIAFTTRPPIVADRAPLPLRLGGVEVRVNDAAVPLLSVSESHITFQCPSATEPGTPLQVAVHAETGAVSRPLNGTMHEATPGLFTLDSSGTGQGAVLIAGTYQLAMPATAGIPSRPARKGMQPPEFLSIYASGLGPAAEVVPAGSPAPLDRLIRLQRPVRVFLGEVELQPDYAGLAPGAIGLYQINLSLPPHAPSGDAVPLRVEVTRSDGTVLASNTVTVAIQ